jgi:hypothetical protein
VPRPAHPPSPPAPHLPVQRRHRGRKALPVCSSIRRLGAPTEPIDATKSILSPRQTRSATPRRRRCIRPLPSREGRAGHLSSAAGQDSGCFPSSPHMVSISPASPRSPLHSPCLGRARGRSERRRCRRPIAPVHRCPEVEDEAAVLHTTPCKIL